MIAPTKDSVARIDSTPKLESLMAIEPSRLTVHVYTLGVSDGEREIDYATMTEIHHPDYLRTDRLREIYDIVGMSEVDGAIEQSLAVMAEQIR